jgi:hypothetical protein
MNDKRQRQQQLQLLEQKSQELAQMQEIIDQRNGLQVREAKLKEMAPLIPSLRQMQQHNITFDLIIPYMITRK